MTLEEMRQQIEDARKVVNTWPEWKQNILIHSAQPTVSTPREPVNNQNRDRAEQKAG
jgi:hypothetical protein